MNQSLTIPRCCTSLTLLDQTAFWIIGFMDGSLDYSAACIYLISASKVNTDCKAQLITTPQKLQHMTSPLKCQYLVMKLKHFKWELSYF